MKAKAVFSGYSVDDQAAAKEFYTNTLGLELDDEKMGLQFKLPSGGKLFLYEKPGHEPAGFTVLNFVVDNIDEAVQELKSNGVLFEFYPDMFQDVEQEDSGILRSPDTEKYGPSIAWFRDPADNILSVIEDPK